MPKIKFQLVTPQKTVLNEELDSLSCPTLEGEITILPQHVPLIATLGSGELIARNGTSSHSIAVSGGFVEVRPGSEVIVLADIAQHARELDLEAEEAARELAQENMRLAREKNVSSEEYAALTATLQRSLSRIKVARKHAPRTPGSRFSSSDTE